MAHHPEFIEGFESLTHGTYDTECGSKLSFHYTPTEKRKADQPVLMLQHGWPESSYMWRHIIPALSAKGYTIFCPDLPGYGFSTPSQKGDDRLTVSRAIFEAAAATYGSPKPLKVIMVTHDRGARAAQFACMRRKEITTVEILGALLMDIVPYADQWAGFLNPKIAVGYFHWVFMPKKEIAVPMIKAYGGGKFASTCLLTMGGHNEKCLANLSSGKAIEHYAKMYDQDSVIQAAADDYESGAFHEVELSRSDAEKGAKIDVPLYVLYSERNIGANFDVDKVWRKWVKEGTPYESHPIGGGAGHFFAEENPEETIPHVLEFLKKFGL